METSITLKTLLANEIKKSGTYVPPSFTHCQISLFEKVRVLGNVVFPLCRKLIFHKNSINRTLRLTQSAVDALVRVNKELVFSLMDTVDWTDSYAGFVFDADAGFSNHIRHNESILQEIVRPLYWLRRNGVNDLRTASTGPV